MDLSSRLFSTQLRKVTPPTTPEINKKSELSAREDRDLRESTQQFEAMFVKQMLDTMRKTIPQGGLLGKNTGQEIFEDMLYQNYADSLSRTSNLGLAKQMYDEMSAKV